MKVSLFKAACPRAVEDFQLLLELKGAFAELQDAAPSRKGETLQTDLVAVICCNGYLIEACIDATTGCLSEEVMTANIAS